MRSVSRSAQLVLLSLTACAALAACGSPRAQGPEREPSPAAAPARGEPRLVLRVQGRALVVAGGLRAVLEPSGAVQVAADAFALPILGVVQHEDGRFTFVDAGGAVRSSESFLGRLERSAGGAVGPALVHRRPGGVFLASFGGSLEALSVPERALSVELSSPRAGLAYADGGLLYRTRDGGASWQLIASGVDADAPSVHGLAEVRVRIAGEPKRLSADGELVAVEDGTPLRPLEARERAALRAALEHASADPVIGGDLARPSAPRDPRPGVLRCHADGPPRPAPGSPLSAACTAGRCRVRAGAWRFDVATDACATDAAPVLQLEWSTPEHALVSCEVEGVACPCVAPSYWVRPRGVTSLERPIAAVREVLPLDDGGIAIRSARSTGDEQVLHVDASGHRIGERLFQWHGSYPRALRMHAGRPHLAVASRDLRAVDLFALDAGEAVARVPARVRAPRRTCDPADAGVRLVTDRALLDVVGDAWPGPAAHVLELRAGEADTCLERAVITTDRGRAELRPSGARQLTGMLQEDSGITSLRCVLDPIEAERE